MSIYILFIVAALVLVTISALIWRFWQSYAQVSPEEEELDRSIASLNDSQANRASDQQLARRIDTDTGWQIMVARGQRTPRRERPSRRPRR